MQTNNKSKGLVLVVILAVGLIFGFFNKDGKLLPPQALAANGVPSTFANPVSIQLGQTINLSVPLSSDKRIAGFKLKVYQLTTGGEILDQSKPIYSSDFISGYSQDVASADINLSLGTIYGIEGSYCSDKTTCSDFSKIIGYFSPIQMGVQSSLSPVVQQTVTARSYDIYSSGVNADGQNVVLKYNSDTQKWDQVSPAPSVGVSTPQVQEVQAKNNIFQTVVRGAINALTSVIQSIYGLFRGGGSTNPTTSNHTLKVVVNSTSLLATVINNVGPMNINCTSSGTPACVLLNIAPNTSISLYSSSIPLAPWSVVSGATITSGTCTTTASCVFTMPNNDVTVTVTLPAPSAGIVTIKKVTLDANGNQIPNPGDPQQFTFNLIGPNGYTSTKILDTNNSSSASGTQYQSTDSFASIPVGPLSTVGGHFVLTEAATPGWFLKDIDCEPNTIIPWPYTKTPYPLPLTTGTPGSVVFNMPISTFNSSANNVTCTFTNQKLPPPTCTSSDLYMTGLPFISGGTAGSPSAPLRLDFSNTFQTYTYIQTDAKLSYNGAIPFGTSYTGIFWPISVGSAATPAQSTTYVSPQVPIVTTSPTVPWTLDSTTNPTSSSIFSFTKTARATGLPGNADYAMNVYITKTVGESSVNCPSHSLYIPRGGFSVGVSLGNPATSTDPNIPDRVTALGLIAPQVTFPFSSASLGNFNTVFTLNPAHYAGALNTSEPAGNYTLTSNGPTTPAPVGYKWYNSANCSPLPAGVTISGNTTEDSTYPKTITVNHWPGSSASAPISCSFVNTLKKS